MPAWQLETSLPDLKDRRPQPAGANEDLRPMNANTPLRRRERDRAHPRFANGLEPAKEDNRSHRKPTNTNAHGATWTSERVAQLKGCIGAGLTCSQIAAEIGVTRNAVIGKMNRLGLSRPKDTPTLTLPRGRGREWEGAEPKRAAGRARNVTRLFTQHRIFVELPPAPPAQAEATSIHNGRGCSFLELSPGKCRWPISEPGAADFCFCGNAQVEGLPYCVGHARIAYKSAARGSARL
jgi:GcrA cell cycle regulator